MPRSDVDRERVRLERDREVVHQSDTFAVDEQTMWANETPGLEGAGPRRDSRMRDVGALRKSAASLEPLPNSHLGVDLDDVESTVVGVCPRRHVPSPDVVDVQHGDDLPPPPRAAYDDMGNRAVAHPVCLDPQQVDRQPLYGVAASRGADSGEQVAAGHPERPLTTGNDQLGKLSIGLGDRQLLRPRDGTPPWLAFADRHGVSIADESATTPLNAASLARRAVARVVCSGATTAI